MTLAESVLVSESAGRAVGIVAVGPVPTGRGARLVEYVRWEPDLRELSVGNNDHRQTANDNSESASYGFLADNSDCATGNGDCLPHRSGLAFGMGDFLLQAGWKNQDRYCSSLLACFDVADLAWGRVLMTMARGELVDSTVTAYYGEFENSNPDGQHARFGVSLSH